MLSNTAMTLDYPLSDSDMHGATCKQYREKTKVCKKVVLNTFN